VPEVIRCMLLYMPGAVEGRLYSLEGCEVLDVLDVPEVIRCMLLCLPWTVEGRLCSLEVL